jgi:hypothetical protein
VIQLRTDYKVGHEIAQRQYGAAAPSLHRPAAPRTINVDTIEVLVRGRVFSFKGDVYVVELLDWWDGCVLEYLMETIAALFKTRISEEVLQELKGCYEEAYELIWRNARPRSKWLRVRRWLSRRWNPLTSMTNMEFSAIVDFCSECRTRLPNLALDSTPGSRHASTRRATSRTHGVNSRTSIRRSRTRAADR